MVNFETDKAEIANEAFQALSNFDVSLFKASFMPAIVRVFRILINHRLNGFSIQDYFKIKRKL